MGRAFALGLLTASLWGCEMIEKGLIFFPTSDIAATPADVGLAFEEAFLTTSDGVRLHGWFVPHPAATATVVWLHGNAGNISHRVDQLAAMHPALRANILMLDYREYGRSEGSITEAGSYLDAEAAFDDCAARAGATARTIVVYGQSLGANVAVELALRRPVAGLILEAPFLSVQAMARTVAPWFPVGGLFATRYDAESKIGKVRAPVLIAHGDRDEIVPTAHGLRLFERVNAPKQLYVIPGSGHNDTYLVGGAAYFEVMAQFIATARGAPP